MKGRITILSAAVLGLLTLLATGRAETWVLANGDRLTGELVREDPAFIEVQHAQLGRLKVPRTALRVPDPAAPPPDAKAAVPAAAPVQASKPDIDKWKRQVDLGYVQQSGAREKEDISVRVQLDGREGANTYRGTARLLQSEADGKTVTNRREAEFRWRYDINKRLFTQALTTYESDEVRKMDLSLEQQIGGGYRILDSPRHKVNVGLGAVVQYLERANTAEQTAVLGSFFQDYAYQWTNRVKLTQESSVMISDTGTLNIKSTLASAPIEGSYRMKFNTGVQSKVTDHMSLNVRFEYDYDRSILDSELRADQRLTTSLGYIW